MTNDEHNERDHDLSALASGVFTDSSDYVNSRLSLAVLEAKLAFSSGAAIVALGVAVAVLSVSLWTLVLFTLAQSLVSAGLLSLLSALGLVVVMNIILIAFLILKIIGLKSNISLERSLNFDMNLALLKLREAARGSNV